LDHRELPELVVSLAALGRLEARALLDPSALLDPMVSLDFLASQGLQGGLQGLPEHQVLQGPQGVPQGPPVQQASSVHQGHQVSRVSQGLECLECLVHQEALGRLGREVRLEQQDPKVSQDPPVPLG
jgi:hypothetical protein